MALDFSVLQGMDPAGAFFRGQEAVRAEADRNLLRQAKMEQMAAQRENMLAQREDRNALRRTQEAEEARRREMFELDRQLKTVDLASKSLFAATAQMYPAVRDYVARERPIDCAGSFKVEGLGIALFERITLRDPTALEGLPLIRLTSLLARMGIRVLGA